jgi:hypothetical protein
LCGTQLADIGKAMLIYTNDFNDTLPTSLNDLIAYTESTNPEQFICPTYGIKYKYIQGRSLADPPDTVLVYCPKEHLMSDSEFGGPSDKFGINVLFLAGYVKVIDIYELNKLFLIQKIDDKIIK